MKIRKIIGIEPGAPGIHVFSKFSMPRLGLPLLGTILKNLGYQVRIYCQDITPIDWDDVFSADLVLISTITPTASKAYKIADRAREEGIPVVIGGAHVTFLPDEALNHAEYVVRGEGEETIKDLMGWIENGDKNTNNDILGLSYRSGNKNYHNPDRPHLHDLDSLPFPDLSLVQGYKEMTRIPIITSRGCPFNCKFCSVTRMFGKRYRFRSTKSVIQELEKLYSQHPKATFFFYDDNFAANSGRTKNLLREMVKRKITPRWYAQVRADIPTDLELLDLMKQTNCLRLYIGFESINPKTLEDYRKKQIVEDIEMAIDKLRQHGIRMHGMFVFGSDEDSIETFRNMVEFAKKKRIDTVQFIILIPLPGSQLYGEMKKANRILTKDWMLYDGHHVVFKPNKLSPVELQTETINAMKRFYSFWECVKLLFRFEPTNLSFRFMGNRLIQKWEKKNRVFLEKLKNITTLQRA